MKTNSNKILFFGSLLVLVFLANSANGAPISKTSTALPAPCPTNSEVGCVTQNNAWTPVFTNTMQVKGDALPTTGGLAVSSGIENDIDPTGKFLVLQNALFMSILNINGLILGKTDASLEDSVLTIGGSETTNISATGGSVYVNNGGLYSGTIVAPASELKPLCAEQNGNIIICPEPPVLPPPVEQNNTISGQIAYTCNDTYNSSSRDYHEGNAQLRFYFDKPLTEPLVLKFATREFNHITASSGNVPDACYGLDLFPAGSTTNCYQGAGFVTTPTARAGLEITIPAGTQNYLTPKPLQFSGSANRWTCVENGKDGSSRRGPVTEIKNLYIKNVSPSGKTLDFYGTSYQLNFTGAKYMPVTQVF